MPLRIHIWIRMWVGINMEIRIRILIGIKTIPSHKLMRVVDFCLELNFLRKYNALCIRLER
jgi:hypothetical protein